MGCSDRGVCLFGAKQGSVPKKPAQTEGLTPTRHCGLVRHMQGCAPKSSAATLGKETQTCELRVSSYSGSAPRRNVSQCLLDASGLKRARLRRVSRDRSRARARGRGADLSLQPHDAVGKDTMLTSQLKNCVFSSQMLGTTSTKIPPAPDPRRGSLSGRPSSCQSMRGALATLQLACWLRWRR